jgi:hypothetical protein
MTDIQELKRLAEAATPYALSQEETGVAWLHQMPTAEQFMEFMGAANPSTILALIQRIEHLEKELQHIADDCADDYPPSYGAIKQAAKAAIAAQSIKEQG